MEFRISMLAAGPLLAAFLMQGPAMATEARPDTKALTASEKTEAIESLVKALDTTYVFPETARKMAEDIGAREARKEYDAISDGPAFARKLTDDLRVVSHDKHLNVSYHPDVLPPEGPKDKDGERTPEERARLMAYAAAVNGEFKRVERLDGNIGYLRLDGFLPPEAAGDTATAAMNFLADTDALIVDLRYNTGGEPEMIALITSYLFGPQPVHLNDLYWRPTDSTQQFWTLPHVPGRRFGPTKPVYVLTSGRTFSGAEEFANNLKVLKRATIVGETTRGGAHPGGGVRLGDHFLAFVPTGRAINPVTKTNWEGTGVEPDVKVPADEALEVAQRLALKALAGAEAVPPLVEERKKALAALEEKGKSPCHAR
jgi:hypothetical protein